MQPLSGEARDFSGIERPKPFQRARAARRRTGGDDGTDVAVIGAGPYGLSIASHLAARGADFRIVGIPMETWRRQMPAGMMLKSPGFASNLCDPTGGFTLGAFCAETGVDYDPCATPIRRETFAAYGIAFQKRLVPTVAEEAVVALGRGPDGFILDLESGSRFAAHRVIVAIGATAFRHVPHPFADLPPEWVSHSTEHHDLSVFKGRRIAVIGAGASAIDIAAELHQVGAEPHLVARSRSLAWAEPVGRRPVWKRWVPMSGLGGGWNRFYEEAPMLFRFLPDVQRERIVRTVLGPAGAWPVRDVVLNNVALHLSCTTRRAEPKEGGVRLSLTGEHGRTMQLAVDHVIAATGYKVDLARLPMLDDVFRARIDCFSGSPNLSGGFESSVPGLHFVGLAAAHSFGPVMRFVLGAEYTARRLARHIARFPVTSG